MIRLDLDRSHGKISAKLIQAAIGCFNKSPPELQARYLADGEGCQVLLALPDEEALRTLIAQAEGICPTCMAVEDGVLMAAAIGPVMRDKVAHLTRGLPKM